MTLGKRGLLDFQGDHHRAANGIPSLEIRDPWIFRGASKFHAVHVCTTSSY